MNIHETIAEWLKDPAAMEDDGLTAPTKESLVVASMLSQIIEPTRITPTGDGGVKFRWEGHDLEVLEDGSLDFIVWNGVSRGLPKIISRVRWHKGEGRGMTDTKTCPTCKGEGTVKG